MGLIANSLKALVPARQTAVAATIPTWDDGREMQPPSSYQRNARDGYMLDELVYSCVEFRATSAGEPPICAYRTGSDEKLTEHPAITLLNKPNPFMGRSRFWATLNMCMDIGGNAFAQKVRSGAGKVVELWPLRPDRMFVIPDSRTFIGGYAYRIGANDPVFLPPEDVIHFKTRHPMDDYYGLAPLHVLAGRVDLDIWTRRFSEAFFRNAGVPAGLLNIKRTMTTVERENATRNFRATYGGSEGWHKILLIDSDQASYTPMGLPMGQSGLAMADLNEVNETRILEVYGMLPSLIATMAGLKGGALAGGNREADRRLFWESTMIPLFSDLDSTLTMGLIDEFPDLDHLEHDLSTVRALQEDEDKKNDRYIKRYQAGLATFQEMRTKLGMPEEPDTPGMLLVPSTMAPTWSDDMLTEPEPLPDVVPVPPGAPGAPGAPGLPGSQPPQPALPANGRTNGAAH